MSAGPSGVEKSNTVTTTIEANIWKRAVRRRRADGELKSHCRIAPLVEYLGNMICRYQHIE